MWEWGGGPVDNVCVCVLTQEEVLEDSEAFLPLSFSVSIPEYGKCVRWCLCVCVVD